MANVDFPRGMWPIGHLSGGTIRTNTYLAAGTIYRGDLVTAGGGGTITASSADAGITVLGVAAEYGVSGDMIEVYDDPQIIFGIQADTDATAPADDDVVFATANHVAGSGNTTTKISGHELDTSDIGTGLQLRILGLVDEPGNAWGPHADLRVIFNESVGKGAGTATI